MLPKAHGGLVLDKRLEFNTTLSAHFGDARLITRVLVPILFIGELAVSTPSQKILSPLMNM